MAVCIPSEEARSLDLAAVLRRAAPPVRRALDAAVRHSERLGVRSFLVGGFVRDALLGRASADLDLVVEGAEEARAFADALSQELDAQAVEHPRFLTFSLTAVPGVSIDVATARSEWYEAPAALPVVEPATLLEDLARRDFTVNALAMPLAGGEGVIDPYEGRRDLADRRIEVLHAASFEDDPTRALRAVRFEQRLGFRLGEESRGWLRRAVEAGSFERLSSDRLREELFPTLLESARPLAALDRLAELEILPRALPGVIWSRDSRRRLSRAMDEVTPGPSGTDGSLLDASRGTLLVGLAADLAPEKALVLAQRLGLPPRRQRALETLGARLAGASELLADGSARRSQRVAALEPLSAAERRVLAASLGSAEREAMDDALAAAAVGISIGGEDLRAAGVAEGSAIGRALAAVREARIDDLCLPEDELAWALDVARSLVVRVGEEER